VAASRWRWEPRARASANTAGPDRRRNPAARGSPARQTAVARAEVEQRTLGARLRSSGALDAAHDGGEQRRFAPDKRPQLARPSGHGRHSFSRASKPRDGVFRREPPANVLGRGRSGGTLREHSGDGFGEGPGIARRNDAAETGQRTAMPPPGRFAGHPPGFHTASPRPAPGPKLRWIQAGEREHVAGGVEGERSGSTTPSRPTAISQAPRRRDNPAVAASPRTVSVLPASAARVVAGGEQALRGRPAERGCPFSAASRPANPISRSPLGR